MKLENLAQRYLKKGNKNENTFQKIADTFNISMERARQIEAKALRKMRHPKRSDVLKHLL